MKIINKRLSALSLSFLLGLSASVSFAEQNKTLEPVTETKVVPVELQFSDAEIDQMLAPVALYPDTLLSQVLVAATYPVEIIQANRWVIKHPDLDANEALERVKDKDWDASVKALVPFPRILAKMSEDLEWTQNLGDAFLQDEKVVLDRIQALREQAYAAGNLKDAKNLKVVKEKQTIVIEPAEPEVIYVPYYDPRIVYGSWRWSSYPPYYWDYPYYGYSRPYNHFYWAPGIHFSIGFGFGFNWFDSSLIYVDHYYPHHYYTNRQIVRSHYARRWRHNPYHRRGAVYRSRAVTHRYHSNRPARSERHLGRNEVILTGNSRHRTLANGSILTDIKGHQRTNVLHPNTRQHRIQAELTERSRTRGNRQQHLGNRQQQSRHHQSFIERNSPGRRSSHPERNIKDPDQRTAPVIRPLPVVKREPRAQVTPTPGRSSYQRSEPRLEYHSNNNENHRNSSHNGSNSRRASGQHSSGHHGGQRGHSRSKR